MILLREVELKPLEVVSRPLTLKLWGDLEKIFGARGCSQARGCWCMYYRETGKVETPQGLTPREYRKRRLMELAASDEPPGLLGYLGEEPVGWVSLGPRSSFPRLARSPVMKPVDDIPVWSMVCFVVPGPYRRRGVAASLLAGAIEYARGKGARVLEAYPFDRPGPGRDEWLWFGTKSMFHRAGFVEVARRKADRPVVRLNLAVEETEPAAGGHGHSPEAGHRP